MSDGSNSNNTRNIVNEELIFDIAIVGGGLAGSIAAYGLAEIGLCVALIETRLPEAPNSSSFDQRSVALSASSVKILQALGLWENLKSLACPIKNIHVSEEGQFGFARLDASSQNIDALGQVIPLGASGPALWEKLNQQDKVTKVCPASVAQIETDGRVACLKLETEIGSESITKNRSEIRSRLVLVADGTFSKITNQLGIHVNREPYQQVAIIANLMTDQPHKEQAFERFTKNGPLALLPLRNNQLSLVWCQKTEDVDQLMQLEDQAFLEKLQATFGYRLGRFTKVSQRYAYPLSSHWPEQAFKDNFLLMGNAAHTLHPIAGQGINLGLRDIAFLIEHISQAENEQRSFENEACLKAFQQARKDDWQLTHLATDSLARLFSNEFYPLTIARNKGLALFNRLPIVKQWLANAAMGFHGNNAKLARGYDISEFKALSERKASL